MEHRQLRRDQPGFASFRMPCRLGLGETDDHKAHGGVYTIERLPESPVKDDHGVLAGLGGFSPTGGGQQHRKSKVATLAAALLLGTIIVLLTTAALVYTLRTVHTTYRTSPATTSSWASEMIVTGEFRLTNEPFRTSLYNLSSPDFKQLSRRIEKVLERLYGDSGLKDEVLGVAVTSFSPGLEVRCSLTLLPRDSLTIGKVGLTFLAGLNQSHGHLWLGPFAVDVLSIGFQARTEEVSWSQWSDWSSCQTEDGTGRLVRTRRRVCLSLEGLKLSRAQPCQAISKPVITNDTEVQLCPQPDDGAGRRKIIVSSTPKAEVKEMRSEEVMRKRQPVPSRAEAVTLNLPLTTASPLRNSTEAAKSLVPFTTTAAQSDSTTAGHEVTAAPTTVSSTTPTTTTTTPVPERIGCSSCEINEVCVALEGDPVPLCRPILDHDDPTGCGGLCQLNTEVCHRLGQGAYRCVDDSKCLDNEWQCGNMLCIPLIKRCDGHFNCYDHTDEHNCECDLNTHFQCGKNLSCLPQSKRCDGIVDCWDAADESNCTIACLDQTQFTCNDSQCIPSKNFCDGFIDCKDHSDEPFGCGGVCKNHEWRCRNGRCIVKRDVCNGQDDCGDFSDEIKCGKRRAGRK